MWPPIARLADWFEASREPKPDDVDTPIGRLLWRDPRPLIDPRNRLLVIFSPKAACSNVVVWFFHHLGHSQAARDYHHFPHRYRLQVYYQSKLYQDAYRDDFTRYHVIRVIRDPFQRAASAYRHLLAHPKGRMSRRMGMTHIARKGLSFADYLNFLEQLDLKTCDSHFAVQRHPIEDVLRPAELINVSTDDLYTRLNAIEDRIGLPRTDLRSLDWVSSVNRRNRPARELDSDDVHTTPLFPLQAKKGPWPRYESLLTPDARARLAKLYAVDIDSYNIAQSDVSASRAHASKVEMLGG